MKAEWDAEMDTNGSTNTKMNAEIKAAGAGGQMAGTLRQVAGSSRKLRSEDEMLRLPTINSWRSNPGHMCRVRVRSDNSLADKAEVGILLMAVASSPA
jgi:hypothetical protein